MKERGNKTIWTRISGAARSVFDFYVSGFRSMTIGRTLWAIILIKLFVFFVIIKWIFFPNLLERDYDSDADRADHVRQELIDRTGGR